ncbi:MAG: hypothetical protein ACREJQ_01320 [bacterium]
MALISFAKNLEDLSTDLGYQFKFLFLRRVRQRVHGDQGRGVLTGMWREDPGRKVLPGLRRETRPHRSVPQMPHGLKAGAQFCPGCG